MKGRENLKDVGSDGTISKEWLLPNKKNLSQEMDQWGPLKHIVNKLIYLTVQQKASDVFLCILAVKLV
jgi:type II secretory ATPase GspE/PulE/Tfp pilus assembly ATPase PilB-like protein